VPFSFLGFFGGLEIAGGDGINCHQQYVYSGLLSQPYRQHRGVVLPCHGIEATICFNSKFQIVLLTQAIGITYRNKRTAHAGYAFPDIVNVKPCTTTIIGD
jgi:hypothetical protein